MWILKALHIVVLTNLASFKKHFFIKTCILRGNKAEIELDTNF